MKKAVVFGGCGEVGKVVVRDLVETSDFDTIVIADAREEASRTFIRELDRELDAATVTFQKVNAYDQPGLIAALEGATIAVNTIGPFYEFASLVANAVYQAGVNYVDVCDDPDAAITLLAMDSMVARKGLTFLICQGWTPGMMNLIAKKGAEQMDEVDAMRLAWVQDMDEEIGVAPIMHWGHITATHIPTYRDRKWVMVPGLSEREEVRFPEPVGVVPVYHAGHPEPVTLPRYFDVRLVACKGGLIPPELVTVTKIVEATGAASTPGRIRVMAKMILPLLPVMSKIGGQTSGWSGSRVEVTGRKDGQAARVVYGLKLRVGEATGRSAAIGTQMVANGEITAKGVMPPEACVDTKRYFEEFEKRGVTLIEME